MTKNTLADLNNHLFAELERLGNEELSEEELKQEIDRAKAIGGVAQQVIANAGTVLRAMEFADLRGDAAPMPSMLTGGEQ